MFRLVNAFSLVFHVAHIVVLEWVGCACIPLIKSIQLATLIFSLVFIILSASSSSTSPVNVSSMTSITRSCSGNRRLEASFCMLILPLKASSMTIHPRSAYDILSFQKLRYPYHGVSHMSSKFPSSSSPPSSAIFTRHTQARQKQRSTRSHNIPAYPSSPSAAPPPSAST